MVGIFFVQLGGDFEADAYGAEDGTVGYPNADAAAVLAGVKAADGNEGLIHEVDAGKIFCVEQQGDFFAVDPGSAEFFKRRFGSPAYGDACVLKNFEAG